MTPTIKNLVQRIIELRAQDKARLTLLAACPNSIAVLEAAVLTAARNNTPMLFAATLNQVDRDGGYTGWTPATFVRQMETFAARYHCHALLYPCLDHGGPWLKDKHTRDQLSLAATMSEVKQSLTACIEAGYALLHIDTTVNRQLPPGQPPDIDWVVERTVELILYCEAERKRLGSRPFFYEVGTEEVHGGLVDMNNFTHFLQRLRADLATHNLLDVWPCFIVGKVGTDLQTSFFAPDVARELTGLVRPLGSVVKGHYTDWVENPEEYPATGMGGANIGPEFTTEEYLALVELTAREADLLRGRHGRFPSGIVQALEDAVVASGRWQKWLQAGEKGRDFKQLSEERRNWLVQTGARYIWTDSGVVAARQALYNNLSTVMAEPNQFVVERIARAMEKYVTHFHLFDAVTLLDA